MPLIFALLFGEAAPIFEQTRCRGPKDHATDVRQIGHAARLYIGDCANAEKLNKKPETDQRRGRDERDLGEPAKKSTVRILSRG